MMANSLSPEEFEDLLRKDLQNPSGSYRLILNEGSKVFLLQPSRLSGLVQATNPGSIFVAMDLHSQAGRSAVLLDLEKRLIESARSHIDIARVPAAPRAWRL